MKNKVNKMKIAIFGIAVLFALLAVSTASANVSLYFVPAHTTAEPCTGHYSAEVQVWLSTEGTDTAKSGQFAIHYDPSCINITEHPTFGVEDGWNTPCVDHTMSSWNAYSHCCGDGYDMVMYTFSTGVPHAWCPSPLRIANFTVRCESSACLSTLSISCGRDCYLCPIQILDAGDDNLYPDNTTFVDGTFDCRIPSNFEKELCLGWNLISLPLTPVNNSTSAVLGNDTIEYDVVYRYNATAKQFECPSTMDPGIGYFVNVTTAGTWNYTGTAYTSMNVELKQGLNCIGWVNTSANLPDAMSSISGNYRYVAGWDASNSKYEVYDANAPAGVPEFIDFVTMGRGNGYWIAAKEDCTLTVS